MANTFVNAGKAWIAGLVTGDNSKPANYYIAWGSGTGQMPPRRSGHV